MVEDSNNHNNSSDTTGNKANVANATNTLSVAIKDKNVLYATYMGFIKPDGGIFIPTKKEFVPGHQNYYLENLHL